MQVPKKDDHHNKKKSSTKRVQLWRQRKKATLSPEEKKNKTEKQTAYVKLWRERKKASLSPEEKKSDMEKQTAYVQRHRQRKKTSQEDMDTNQESIQEKTCDYNIPVDIKSPIRQAYHHDQKQIMKVDNNPNACRVAVCVLCDRLIIGCELIYNITREKLLSQSHRISCKGYEVYHQVKLKDALRCQYQISDHGLEDLLLSPRAKKTRNKNGEIAFEACSQCYKAWQNKDTDNPPKHAISNGFAIGYIPENIIKQDKVTEMMSSFVAPVRPFAYVFAYTAGAHKSIRGHFSFFEVNLSHVGSTINHFLKTGANPLVYLVLCGRMTPKQKQIIRDRATLDTKSAMKLLEWFVKESGHPGYKNVTPPSDCPQPRIIADEDTPNNTDEEHDPDKEKDFAGASFHFTSAHEPQDDAGAGIYETNQKFLQAMLDRTMPTLLVCGSNYTDLRELLLENIAPIQFPFGQGGPKTERRTHISPAECYLHERRLPPNLEPYVQSAAQLPDGFD
ncbi:hypothetical protein ACHAWC_005529 [Mediolabrus comicus]